MKESLFSLNTRLGGLRSRYGHFREDKILVLWMESKSGQLGPQLSD